MEKNMDANFWISKTCLKKQLKKRMKWQIKFTAITQILHIPIASRPQNVLHEFDRLSDRQGIGAVVVNRSLGEEAFLDDFRQKQCATALEVRVLRKRRFRVLEN